VATLLRAYGDPITGLGHRYDGLAYWAPSTGGLEVDFVLRRGRHLAAIEAKAKLALSSRDFSGLRAIGELPDVRRRVLVFLGDRPYRTEDGVDVLPVRDFIDEVEAGRI
jgi:predicted AAA+ superfamily ATPase